MEPCTGPVLLTGSTSMQKISERLKLWMSSHMLLHDTSSGLVELMRSAMADQLLTRHDLELITCQSSGADHLDLPLSEPPLDHCHVQNDGDEYQDEETSDEDFWTEDDLESLQLLSWPSDTPSSPLIMWRQSEETVRFLNCIDNFRTEVSNPFVDMLCGLSSIAVDASVAENSNRGLGLCIVITPPDNSWDTSCYTVDNNRIGPQYFTSLAVSPFYQSTSRLIKYEEWMALYHPPVGTVSHDQLSAMPSRTSYGPLVFRPNAFKKYLQETKNDRNDCCHLVTALQRYQLKAVAFAASSKACLFRMHYDIPGFLENIEPRFKWIDPAEILIESFRHTTQSVIIYTSHRPCSVPHIVVHESPPNDPYVVWNNSPDSQNYCFLAISSPDPSIYDYIITDNYFTDTSSSLFDSSAPVTPKDFSCPLEQDLDIFPGEDTYDTPNKDEFMIPRYFELSDGTTFPSNSKFFTPDDKEEDSLPPLDDWYITISNRCMPPEKVVAERH